MTTISRLKRLHSRGPSAGDGAGTKGAATGSRGREGGLETRGGEKESLCEGAGLCKVLRVSVNESGAGLDGMEAMSGFRKGKREGEIKGDY